MTKTMVSCSPRCVTIQSSYGSSSPLWSLWISGSRCSRIQRMMHRWCPWWCDRGRGTAPGGTDQDANCKSCILKWGKICIDFGKFLPSTSWKCSLNSLDLRSQNHPSWTSLHTGRRPGTCPLHKDIDEMKVKQPVVMHHWSSVTTNLAHPVLSIYILICIPFPGEKRPLPADDLSGEERG